MTPTTALYLRSAHGNYLVADPSGPDRGLRLAPVPRPNSLFFKDANNMLQARGASQGLLNGDRLQWDGYERGYLVVKEGKHAGEYLTDAHGSVQYVGKESATQWTGQHSTKDVATSCFPDAGGTEKLAVRLNRTLLINNLAKPLHMEVDLHAVDDMQYVAGHVAKYVEYANYMRDMLQQSGPFDYAASGSS